MSPFSFDIFCVSIIPKDVRFRKELSENFLLFLQFLIDNPQGPLTQKMKPENDSQVPFEFHQVRKKLTLILF